MSVESTPRGAAFSRVRGVVTQMVFPGASVPVTAADVAATLRAHETVLEAVTSHGERLGLVHRPPAPGADGRHVLLLYGNGMTLADTGDLREVLGSAGAGVLCVDYPGYGLSGGRPTEAGCYRAAEVALDVLADRFGAGPDRVDLVGWSLGSAVAVHVAGGRPVRRLVLLSPFSGVSAFVLGKVGLAGTPLRRVGPFAGRRASSIACPTLLVTGDADTLTPPAMAHDLARRIGPRAELVSVPGAGHSDLFSHAVVWRSLLDFLAR